MANLLSNTTIGGYQSIHTGNVGSYALTSLPSHNHDDRYYTESESDSRYIDFTSTQNVTGIKYFFTNNGYYSGSTDSAKLQVYATGANAAFMSFHRGGSYAVNFGLDADNVMRIGGWSAASNRWQLDMSGNNTIAGNYYGGGAGLTGTASSLNVGSLGGYSLDTMKKYIWSRGENLLTNGTGLMGNNTNFSSFTFDGSQAYFSSGSFRYTGQYNAPNTDELMPVNPEKRYRLDFWAKTANGQGAYYAYLNFFDVDGNTIVAPYHMYYANTLTTLAQTLNPGDTVAYLTSVANWENGGTAGVSTHIRSFIFWNYSNSFGYLYPPQTYSRNWYPDAWNPGAINSGNNTITLRVPWSGPSIAAGTQVSNGSAGGTYKYIALGYTIVPTTWTNYVGIMDGVDYSGSNAGGKFPPGTAAAKLGFLTDYNASGDTIYLANLFVGVDNDYPIYDRWTGNTRIEKAGAFYGTIFYDSNNDGYYLDPNSTSNLYRVDAAAQMRAPIFYDSQDTNYYLDPNSTSRLDTVNANTLRSYGNVYTDGNFGHGLVGLYNSTRYQGVFAMGDSYKLTADGTGTGTLYGIAWTHTNVGGQSKSGLGHQALFMDNGVTQTAIGSGIWTAGLITTTSYGTSANWNTAYSWGNHASAGYLTSVPAQSQLISPNGATVVAADSAMPNAGHSFIHSLALGPGGNDGHILGMSWAGTTSVYGAQIFLDTDPNDIMAIRSRSNAGVWTSWKTIYHNGNFTDNSSNWNTAFGWGNHATAGYLTGITSGQVTGALGYTPYNASNPAGYITSSGSISGNANTTSQKVFNDLKINFPSGAGGGYSFAANHYSMGLDSGNGGWDGPHYRDVIIGYHTGVRIGAHYSGIRFYNNSPTTDANNDGNGDGGEALLMTIGGYVGTANHTDVVVNNNLIANVSLRAPIFYDSNDTSYYLDPNGNSVLTTATFNVNASSTLILTSAGTNASQIKAGAGDELYIGGNNSWQMRFSGANVLMDNGGYLQNNESLRAPIFYDSQDTNYYVDPNSTSNLSASYIGRVLINYDGTDTWFRMQSGNRMRITTTGGTDFIIPNTGEMSYNGNTVIHTGNIGSQSVSYASTAGSLSSMNISQFTNNSGYITGYTETDTLASVTGRGATTGTLITLTKSDVALKVQEDGTGTAWRGRLGTFNATADKSAFLGNYLSRAGVFGHNNALTAWDDLWVNTLGIHGQGNLYLSWNTYVKGSSNDTNYGIWHAGNLTNLNQLTNGPGYITGYTETDTLATVTARGASTNGSIYVNGLLTGGLGAATTGGTLDWNDSSNARAGQGYTLLLGSHSNGPGPGEYFHPVGFEYASKNGGGNVTQLAISYGSPGDKMYMRGRYDGSWTGWTQFITSANIGSQSVNYAATAGSAPANGGNSSTVGGYSVSVGASANTIPTRNSSGYLIPESWIQLNGIYGLYSPTNGAHLRPNDGSYGSWMMTGSRNSWQGIEFNSGNSGNVTLMINVSSNTVGFHNNSYGWQFLWESGTLYCFKNAYGGGTQATVLDSSNYSSWAQPIASAINTGNIGSQSVSYASSAGSVAWTNVSSRPTALSQFTNDLGNYGGFLTSITAHSHAISDVSGLQTALDGKQASGSYLLTSGKAADSELIDGIDSSRILYGDGDKKSTNFSDMNAYNQSSGFFFYNQPTGNPFSDWTNWINVMGNSWNNNYGFQIAHAFHNDGFAVRRVTNGSFASWRTIIDSGNIGSQSVSYASSAGSAPANGGNSSTVGGYAPSGSVGANTVVIRDANNYIYAHYINSNVSESENPTINSFYTSNGDGWLRKSSVAHVKSQLGLGSMAYESSGTYQTVSGAINTGNIGSQSVSYATTSQQLTKFGDIYGQDWNSYYINGKMIVSSVYGGSGPNFPTGAYNYGAMLSYGVTGSDFFQVYFPENGALQGGAFRKLHYRTGWNGSWSAWKSVVDQEGQVCTIAGSNQTGIEIHSNVGYNQDPLTYFLMRGQADTSWKALKVRLTGDAGGQDIEFRRIAENGTDARMWYIPRGANTVNFDYPIVQPSDSRLKDNITPISTPVDKIKSLRGVEFDWNSGEQVGTHDVGLIAQDVEAVLPEAVTTQEDGYKNLAYAKVIPLLVEAMKEQQAMIEALKAEIELLKNK